MMNTIRNITILMSGLILLTTSSLASAEKRQTIRFYKLNSKDQPVRVIIRGSTAKKTGCHNFITKKRIFRLTQIGFEYCTVYAKSSCEAGTEISGIWDKTDTNTQLTQGGEWLFTQDNPKGIKMKSWLCQ